MFPPLSRFFSRWGRSSPPWFWGEGGGLLHRANLLAVVIAKDQCSCSVFVFSLLLVLKQSSTNKSDDLVFFRFR